ncbi:eCIS core domain-containing protein [Streptomyces sp. CA-135486]|uniref:eCIS core domain-containing protein n=1 Tax=Streptomyces sp. CA-135486 TaxID=3240049 RepID=UPI003D92FA10
MSTSHAQDAQAAQAERRRKRKERAKSRTPEPKNIVSGAGQPLDLSVRRELEEQLGHDFSRVRLHTDRDAGTLTELLGADAVAVGQDIFFREGAYRPGTADGQRLLAHELLHTVQNPDGLGALRAGRDLGAVSLPQQAVEREAESAAQALVRDGGQAPEVAPDQSTPGWLRYATVDADRSRMEQLDPATLVDRLANGVLRSLRGDPADLSHRVRLQLARMSPQLQDSVLDRLEVRLLSNEYDRLLDLAEAAEARPVDLQPADVPEPEIDLFEELGVERTQWKHKEEGKQGSKGKQSEDAREEQKDVRARDEKHGGDRSRAQSDAVAEKAEGAARTEQEDKRAQSRQQAAQEQRQEEEKQGQDRQRVDEAADERAQGQADGAEQAKEERKEQRDREEQDPEQANAPGADKRKRKDDAKKPADGSKQENLDPKAKGQPGPVRPERVDERAEQSDSALSEHGLHEKDEDEGEPREEEKPLGLEAGADGEIAGEQDGDHDKGRAPNGGPELKPEDYLPDADLDLSSVPTAGQMTPGAAQPSVPTFPTPPPTKAERVEQQRDNETQEEDEDGTGPEAKAPGEDEGPVEGEAPKPEGGPAAQAQDRSANDLQPDKPTDQEVGPDPETTEKDQQEPEAEKKDPAQQQDDGAAKDEVSGDGEERPDAKDAQDEQRELKEREQRGEQGQPQGAAADKPAAVSSSPDTAAGPAAMRPAGAQTQKTSTEDRNPSPAARRDAEPPKSEREAAGPKSQIPKETGPGAAPRGTVGAVEQAGPTAAAGPGAAPSAAQAAVSPAGEQTDSPGKMGAPAPEGAQAAPEASLEKDGGGCAPPEPAAEKEEGGGSCGGGGGGPAPEEKQQEPPDVSGQDPKAAIGTVSKLAPDQAAAAMPGVDAAADKKIGEEQQRLDANPPKRERPSGAPRTQSGPPEAAAPAAPVTGKVEKLGPEERVEQQKAKGSEKAAGAKPTDNTPPPPAPVAEKLTAEEAKNVDAAADAVPTVDPELRNKTVGPAPKIRLEGESDPKRTDDQAKALKEKQSDIQSTGREDAAKPMGEDQIFPDAPQEQLVGKATGGRRRGGRGNLEAASAPKPGVGAVAKQERGSEIQGAAGQAQGDLVAKEKEQQQGEQQAKKEKQTEIDREVTQNAQKQTAERGRAAEDAQRERESWRNEQDQKIEDADKKSEKEHTDKNKEIVKARDDKDKEVSDRKDKDNAQIDTEREKAEKEAEKKKEEEKPSGGFFGWVADKVKSAFNAILDAVTKVFDAARKAVNGIIDTFKEWANKAIDFVRDLAIKAINVLADALIAIGDVLLAAFPELRDKFRKAIEGLRDKAIAAVNALADGLKKAVNALLDALAAGLNALLDALEAGIKAVIKIYQAVILGAIKFAQAAIEALGKFAALVADIAPDPGGWISKAGSSAKAGITDHLWGAIKTGVKRWFDTKVEGILGLGKAVINVLVKGCVSIKQIGKMAWDAIIASLPMMIASIVIEKVVSMIVPAAGAILTIVQGLMAAWQSISSILSAFSKFWAYLKAVKAGPAACLFAEAVAAGVVALLDFIANFLMIRLASATKGVGKRLKVMAEKIMKGLKKTGKGAKKAAGEAVNKARGAIRNAKQTLRKPAVSPKPKAKPSANPKALPKPKDAATPKSPAKREPTPTKPKDTTPGPSKDGTPGSQKDSIPRTPKKKKEIEGPKPTRPKKPKSPLGNALGRAKKAVKSALTKVRNAAKTLGKKLKKSKPGKALKNSASKLRNVFKKKRDQLRDNKKKQQDQRKQNQDKHKKDERSKESKEARLQKIVARVRPRLDSALRRGVTGRGFDVALKAARMWYRLTDLSRNNDQRFDITAKLNPERVAGGGFRLTGADLREIIHQVSREMLTDDRVRDSAARMRMEKSADGDAPLDVDSAQDFPGAVNYLRNRGQELQVSTPGGNRTLPPHRPDVDVMEEYRVGQGRDTVREENKAGETNAYTQLDDVKPNSTYPNIARKLAELEKEGLTGPILATALRKFTRSGTYPDGLTRAQKKMIRELHWLMFVRESVRNPANLGFSAMMTTLIAYGDSDWDEAFRGYQGERDAKTGKWKRRKASRPGARGLHPMSMKGAVPAARQLEQGVRGRPTPDGQPSKAQRLRDELVRRETEVAERWLQAHAGRTEILGKTEQEALDEGRRIVKEYMWQYYGLS